jgi:transcriptional regulator with XRE-family HTH domain
MTTETLISPMEWLRQRHNYTKTYVGKVLGMTGAAYGRMEKGMFNVSVEHLKVLGKLYSVPMDFFQTEAPIREWESILESSKYILREREEVYHKIKSNPLTHMNTEEPLEEDLFLANLKINEMRKELNAKEEALHIMKNKYMDLMEENRTLKEALKKNSDS